MTATGRWVRAFLAGVVVAAGLVAGSCGADQPAETGPGGPQSAAPASQVSDLSAALGQATLFARLTPDERAALETAATLRQGTAGERIIEQGQPLSSMFIVVQGEAEVRVDGKLVATLPEQSLVGEMEFLDKLPASADVIVSTHTQLIELDDAALLKVMDANPRLGYVLVSEIARMEGARLRAMDEK
jgi:CRP-like cAMP-binding protein